MPHDQSSIWKGFDVSVAPDILPSFLSMLSAANVSHQVKIPDVQALIDKERAHTARRLINEADLGILKAISLIIGE
jgi:hypothetical protein